MVICSNVLGQIRLGTAKVSCSQPVEQLESAACLSLSLNATEADSKWQVWLTRCKCDNCEWRLQLTCRHGQQSLQEVNFITQDLRASNLSMLTLWFTDTQNCSMQEEHFLLTSISKCTCSRCWNVAWSVASKCTSPDSAAATTEDWMLHLNLSDTA